MQQIQIKILDLRNAVEINSSNAGRSFYIEEIELGAPPQRKAIKYSKGFLKPQTECKAVIIAEGKIRIV